MKVKKSYAEESIYSLNFCGVIVFTECKNKHYTVKEYDEIQQTESSHA